MLERLKAIGEGNSVIGIAEETLKVPRVVIEWPYFQSHTSKGKTLFLLASGRQLLPGYPHSYIWNSELGT